MKKLTRKALVIGIIAGLLVMLDAFLARGFNQTGSFTWVAFVSWTVFFGATTKERFKAILGYVIGFGSAVAIMRLGTLFSGINTLYIAFGSILATMIINFLCIELEAIDKYIPISVSGIFVGIAMTFSGLGVGLSPDTLTSSLVMVGIIVVYGILGLLSGWATLKFGVKE